MKRISTDEIAMLEKVEPQGCAIIKLLDSPIKSKKNVGFAVVGRIIQKDGKTAFVEYDSRIVMWDKFFSVPKRNIWEYLEKTEDEAIIKNIVFENVNEEFLKKSDQHLKAFAIGELEFNEIVPFLKSGTYSFFIEHLNED